MQLNDQETTSMSSYEDSLNLCFEDVTYQTGRIPFLRENKTLLHGISGTFVAGELTAIMGQSGAGKSTLLDILSGYTKPTSGSIYVNGVLRNENQFRRRSCYILQDDRIQTALTVKESLTIAADFKLGNHVSKEQKANRIEEIIKSLGLDRVRSTRSGVLSGGQRKRLAIGLELVSDPAVMFLDEPTSGLDSSLSRQVLFLLHLLARQGRTVVVSMHQPSAALLQMVDRLYAMANGRCTFIGGIPCLINFFKEIDLSCPNYHNPVDFLIELSAEKGEDFSSRVDNGKNLQWTTSYQAIKPEDRNIVKSLTGHVNEDVSLTTLPLPRENPNNKILFKLRSTYPTPVWKQIITLTRRSWLATWRNPSFTYMITGIHCGVALFIGILFHDIGNEAGNMRNNFNYLYFSLMFLMFTAFSAVSINFPLQIPIVRREHFNRWYTTGAFYTSTLFVALPTQTACTLSYALITYFLTGQPLEVVRFFAFCCILVIVTYVALCLGLLNGSIFDVKNGAIFGPFFVMPFFVFSGFLLRYAEAPAMFRWIFHLSFLKHGLVGLVIAIFGMDRPKLPCNSMYCHFRKPTQFIKEEGMDEEKYYMAIVSLFAITAFLVTLTYSILKIRLKHKW